MTGLRAWRGPAAIGAVVTVLMLLVLAPPSGRGGNADAASGFCQTAPYGGCAGDDISLPADSSAVTMAGTGAFSSLKVTVNQTQNLVNQVVSVTWTGATPTITQSGGLQISSNYLQLMECWGDDGTGTGPPPEQCEFGAEAAATYSLGGGVGLAANVGAYPIPSYTYAFTRIMSVPTWTCPTTAPASCQTYAQLQALAVTNPSKAYYDPNEQYIVDPFTAVPTACPPATAGAAPVCTVPETNDERCCILQPPWKQSWDQNPYFNYTTSNEVDFARTYPGGAGQKLFTVDTGLEAPGLGCGQAQPNTDGSTGPPPKCWLVVVPRGPGSGEDPPEDQSVNVQTSPLSGYAWANRIAIPLGFQPIGTACAQGGTARRILGGELAGGAIASWQPVLCAAPGAPAYDYEALGDDGARTQLLTGTGAGMAVVTLPVDPSQVPASNPLVYAPISLSGLAIAFNVQRQPSPPPGSSSLPADEVPVIGRNVTTINLTPRLVAKLLTESYIGSFGPFGPPSDVTSGWGAKNALTLISDPDFLQYNPEFTELKATALVDPAQLIVEQLSSDATNELWRWILGDPAAKAWMAGTADPWGMRVNPYFSTVAGTNPTGTAFDNPPIDDIPKNDPYCYLPVAPYVINGLPAKKLCFLDWSPYTLNLQASAIDVATANSGAKTTFNGAALSTDTAWSANGPQPDEQREILGLTTTDLAARYGMPTASLSQDGDDGPNPTFIAPDSNGLSAGAAAMQPGGVTGVLAPDPTTTASGAYPLSLLTYAAVAPLALDSSARTDYAAVINYAAGAGQKPGVAPGSLPRGYVPLSSTLTAQATQAAALIVNPASLEPTTTTTTAAPTTTEGSSATTLASTSTPTTGTPSPATTTAPVPTSGTLAPSPSAQQPTTFPAPSAVAPPTGSSPPVSRPAVTPLTVAAPTVSLPATAASAAARTPRGSAGPARYALVIALFVGLGAAVSSQLVLFRR
jgi:hypothetical protein